MENDNKAQTLLPSKLFADSEETLVDVHVRSTELQSSNLLTLIRHSRSEQDTVVQTALQAITGKDHRSLATALNTWTHEEGIIRRNGRICVPKDDTI